MASVQATWIDDRDPSVQYSSGWEYGGVPSEYLGTTTGTGSAASSAQLTFNGTSIAVFGTVGPTGNGPPISTYSIDGRGFVNFTAPNVDVNPLYHQAYYSSPSLSLGQHTLVLTVQTAPSNFWLDYFVVGSVLADDPSTSTPASPPPQATTQPQVTTQPSAATPTQATSVQQVATESPKPTPLTTSSTSSLTTSSSLTPTSPANTSTQESLHSATSTSIDISTLLQQTVSVTPSASAGITKQSQRPTNPVSVGAIAGGVGSGVAVFVLVLLTCLLVRFRRRQKALATAVPGLPSQRPLLSLDRHSSSVIVPSSNSPPSINAETLDDVTDPPVTPGLLPSRRPSLSPIPRSSSVIPSAPILSNLNNNPTLSSHVDSSDDVRYRFALPSVPLTFLPSQEPPLSPSRRSSFVNTPMPTPTSNLNNTLGFATSNVDFSDDISDRFTSTPRIPPPVPVMSRKSLELSLPVNPQATQVHRIHLDSGIRFTEGPNGESPPAYERF